LFLYTFLVRNKQSLHTAKTKRFSITLNKHQVGTLQFGFRAVSDNWLVCDSYEKKIFSKNDKSVFFSLLPKKIYFSIIFTAINANLAKFLQIDYYSANSFVESITLYIRKTTPYKKVRIPIISYSKKVMDNSRRICTVSGLE